MTRDQIGQVIRDNLYDLTTTYYSVEDINDSIQDAYDEIAVFTEFIEKIADIPITPNTTYYDFSILIPDYYRLVYMYLQNTKRYIFPQVERNNVNSRTNWDLAQHSAVNFTLHGPSIVGIYGRTSASDEMMKVWYKAQAPTLVGDTQILVNRNYLDLIENYCTADLLEQNQEYIKAQKYWDIYNSVIVDYRTKIQLLSKTDRVFTRVEA